MLVILGVGGIALLTGRRQAEERPSTSPGEAPGQAPSPEFVRRAAAVGVAEGAVDAAQTRPRAAWEVYSSLENQPLGTVNELMPDEPRPWPTGADAATDASATGPDASAEAGADVSVGESGGGEPGAPAGE